MNVGLIVEFRKDPSNGLKSAKAPLMNVGVAVCYP